MPIYRPFATGGTFLEVPPRLHPGSTWTSLPLEYLPVTSRLPPVYRAVIESQFNTSEPAEYNEKNWVEPRWNLGGTSGKVPPPWIPLFIGVSGPLGGMWNLFTISVVSSSILLVPHANTSRALREYSSWPARILLVGDELTSRASHFLLIVAIASINGSNVNY